MVRIKDRYLLVNILYPGESSKPGVPDLVVLNQPTADRLEAPLLAQAIKKEVRVLFGDYGAGAVERSLVVKYLSTATSTFILKISRDHWRLVWSSLTFMDHVPIRNGKPCVFRVVRVSGTIRKVEEEAIRRAKQLILAAKQQADNQSTTALTTLFGGPRLAAGDVVMAYNDDMSDSDEGP